MLVSEAGRHVTKFLELFIDVLLEAKKKRISSTLVSNKLYCLFFDCCHN